MGIDFFGLSLSRIFRGPELKIDKKVATKSPTITSIKEEEVFSPKTKERIRKNKSEENFIKLQVPWIL